MDFDIFNWVVLPLLIMVSRIADVTLGTMRIILISKGQRKIAPIVGFFEVLLWLLIMSQIVKNLDNPMCYLAWGLGFATGIYVGSLVEEKIGLGTVIFRIISNNEIAPLLHSLKLENFSTTLVKGIGSKGEVSIVYIVTLRKKQKEVLKIVNQFNPDTLYTIEDLKSVHNNLLNKSVLTSNEIGKWK